MMSRFYIDELRIVMAVLVAVAVMIAPLSAEASHVEEQSDAHCEFCIDHDDHSDDNDDQDHHKGHHSHGCGGCHIHGYADKFGSAFGDENSNKTRFAYLTSGPPSADSSGLFRPPRS